MRLFYFKPNGYGEECFVMAENEDQAKDALIIDLANYVSHPAHSEFSKDYASVRVKMMTECLNGYTIESFGPGEVVHTEIC